MQLLYLDSTLCDNVIVPRRRPALKGWYYELIKRRQEAEINEGGFGLVHLQPAYVKNVNEIEDDAVEEYSFDSTTPTDAKVYNSILN